MMPMLSEFSFGFALTNELIHWYGTPLTAAPVFPSLIEEGREGGGYDVRLDRPGIPLFLQFKRSERMERATALELSQHRLGIRLPFFRMHLRPLSRSSQHNLLMDLESRGNEVYYAAPRFHTTDELNTYYFANKVGQRTAFFSPNDIGPLPDSNAHHIAFDSVGSAWRLSEPKTINLRTSDELVAHLSQSLGLSIPESANRSTVLPTTEKMRQQASRESPYDRLVRKQYDSDSLSTILRMTLDDMTDVLRDNQRSWAPDPAGNLSSRVSTKPNLLRKITDLALLYFDCQFFVVQGT